MDDWVDESDVIYLLQVTDPLTAVVFAQFVEGVEFDLFHDVVFQGWISFNHNVDMPDRVCIDAGGEKQRIMRIRSNTFRR